MFLLRLVDFFVRMWRLNAFWKVIAPVPVILKRFLALEFVLTFGILHAVLNVTLLAVLHRQDTYGAVWAIVRFVSTLLQGFLMGCKDRSLCVKRTIKTGFSMVLARDTSRGRHLLSTVHKNSPQVSPASGLKNRAFCQGTLRLPRWRLYVGRNIPVCCLFFKPGSSQFCMKIT
jgi:hypothetical protein